MFTKKTVSASGEERHIFLFVFVFVFVWETCVSKLLLRSSVHSGFCVYVFAMHISAYV